jgi:hypothetical protein
MKNIAHPFNNSILDKLFGTKENESIVQEFQKIYLVIVQFIILYANSKIHDDSKIMNRRSIESNSKILRAYRMPRISDDYYMKRCTEQRKENAMTCHKKFKEYAKKNVIPVPSLKPFDVGVGLGLSDVAKGMKELVINARDDIKENDDVKVVECIEKAFSDTSDRKNLFGNILNAAAIVYRNARTKVKPSS